MKTNKKGRSPKEITGGYEVAKQRGIFLQKVRKLSGLTQEEFGHLVEYSKDQISRMERSVRGREIDDKQINKLLIIIKEWCTNPHSKYFKGLNEQNRNEITKLVNEFLKHHNKIQNIDKKEEEIEYLDIYEIGLKHKTKMNEISREIINRIPDHMRLGSHKKLKTKLPKK